MSVLSEFFFSDQPPSVAWAFFRVMNLAARRGIRFPPDLALFGKALVTTEGMGAQLYPEFDFSKELEPYVRKAMQESFSPARVLQKLETDLIDHLGFLMDLPEQVQHVLARLDKGEVRVKLDTEDLKGMLREFDRQNDLRLLGIILAVVALGTVVLLHLEGKTTLFGWPLSNLGLLLIGLFLLWFGIRLRQGPEKWGNVSSPPCAVPTAKAIRSSKAVKLRLASNATSAKTRPVLAISFSSISLTKVVHLRLRSKSSIWRSTAVASVIPHGC